MQRKKVGAIVVKSIALIVMLDAAWHAIAQDAKAPYPSMAPLDQYLMKDRSSEIALARSAAPEFISRDAEVMVLGRHGYETAIKGTNAFVCLVQRSWAAGIDDPDFWNPKLRAPFCLNAPGARSYLPRTIKKTDLILAGRHEEPHRTATVAGRNQRLQPILDVLEGARAIAACPVRRFISVYDERVILGRTEILKEDRGRGRDWKCCDLGRRGIGSDHSEGRSPQPRPRRGVLWDSSLRRRLRLPAR
jgi:hypothetical protein